MTAERQRFAAGPNGKRQSAAPGGSFVLHRLFQLLQEGKGNGQRL